MINELGNIDKFFSLMNKDLQQFFTNLVTLLEKEKTLPISFEDLKKILEAQKANDVKAIEKIKQPKRLYGLDNRRVCPFCYEYDKCYCLKIWRKCKRLAKKAILN